MLGPSYVVKDTIMVEKIMDELISRHWCMEPIDLQANKSCIVFGSMRGIVIVVHSKERIRT